MEGAGAATTPLADVLGRTRAAVLAQLDVPMSTTQLACLLDLSAPTLSVHLKTLHAAGIVASQVTAVRCSTAAPTSATGCSRGDPS